MLCQQSCGLAMAAGSGESEILLTLLVSSGSQRQKSWYRAHSTAWTRRFWPWPASFVAKVRAVMSGQPGSRSRSRRRRLVRNIDTFDGVTKAGEERLGPALVCDVPVCEAVTESVIVAVLTWGTRPDLVRERNDVDCSAAITASLVNWAREGMSGKAGGRVLECTPDAFCVAALQSRSRAPCWSIHCKQKKYALYFTAEGYCMGQSNNGRQCLSGVCTGPVSALSHCSSSQQSNYRTGQTSTAAGTFQSHRRNCGIDDRRLPDEATGEQLFFCLCFV